MLKAPARVSGPTPFISDLHLTASTSATVAVFKRFLHAHAREARTPVTLGDFSKYWAGNGELVDLFHRRIASLFAEVIAAGMRVLFMHSNRDFLLSKHFLGVAHAMLLPDPTVLEVDDGQRIMLTHGDAFCTCDVTYMRFQHWIRKHWVQRVFPTISLRWRSKVAQRIHTESEADCVMLANVAGEPRVTMMVGDVVQEAMGALLEASNISTLIHGHTHCPQLYRETSGERWVLSDWDFDQVQPCGSFLKLQGGTLTVE